MKLSQSSANLIEATIKQAVARYATNGEPNIVTDLHLQPSQTSGEFIIYDDDDTELAATTVEEWATYEKEDFYGQAERILTQLLTKMKNRGAFDRLALMKPYNFTLVDDDRETLAELLLMDDDTLLLSDPLLKGLDQELDTFLKDLLEN